MAKKNKYYVVWRGHEPGVYNAWSACEAQVKGFSGAQYKGFATRAQAERALDEAFFVVWNGRTPGVYQGWAQTQPHLQEVAEPEYRVFQDEKTAWEAFGDEKRGRTQRKLPATTSAPLPPEGERWIAESVAVDAACQGNPGPLEYRGLNLATGQQLFHQGPFAEGTVNIGEFLAIVHALALLKRQGKDTPIYSDSRTALAWVRARQCRTKLIRTATNDDLFVLVDRAEQWLRDYAYANPLLKWETAVWGENPADFGRK